MMNRFQRVAVVVGCIGLGLIVLVHAQDITTNRGANTQPSGPGGAANQLQYNAGGFLGGTSGGTTNGVAITFVAPILGAATATTINKVTITAPAAGSTLTIPDGVTLNAGAGGTLASAAYVATGTSGATVPLLNGVNTWAGNQTFNTQILIPNIATDATKTDATACVDSTSGQLYKGTGTLGICLGTSSMRFKTDIVAMRGGMNELLALTPVNFRYIPGYGDDGAREQYGFIAEDVVHVLPKLVGLDRDGKPNSVDLVAMIPLLVASVKELKAQNDNLREDVRRMRMGQ